ncbi:MAG TPA: S41 family peptidase [Fimbriimonadaceae bacterium]|nr:S41 family peptidase [Fimbriimonadaceae bacterium]HRJ95634.1 S41 family peptidase [Fimbriimonadaceae bacterium]
MNILHSLIVFALAILPGQDAVKARSTAPAIDAQTKSQVLETLAKELIERYIYPDRAKEIDKALKEWTKTPEYTAIESPLIFAQKVNDLLKASVTDAHLRFRYSAAPLPKRERRDEPSPDEERRFNEMVRRANAGFEKVERLPGNVGYVMFRHFAEPEQMARPLESAMTFLANCEAFIIDLRQNGGGSPEGVRLFCSHFFGEKPVHLNDIYFREGEKVVKNEFWTLADLKGPRFPVAPVYVLTSKRTGSGAEECAYNFQQLKRGTIIGESTWGGANPGGTVRLSDHFDCFIPTGRAENPHSKKNWEGTGVSPDIAIDPAKALQEAHTLAIKALIEKTTDPERKTELQNALEVVAKGG